MTSTYTTGLTLEKPGLGDQDNTWGTGALNGNFDVIDVGVTGVLSKDVSGGIDVTLSAGEARNAVYYFIGTVTANINVIVPATRWQGLAYNKTTGSYTVTVKTASGAGAAVTQNKGAILFNNATDVVKIGEPPLSVGSGGDQIIAATSIPAARSIMGLGSMAVLDAGSISSPLVLNGQDVKMAGAADIAAASQLNCFAAGGNFMNVTGNIQINTCDTAQKGVVKWLYFTGTPLIANNSVSNIINNNGNDYQVVAGDRAMVTSLGAGKTLWHITKANGKALQETAQSSGLAAASQAQMEAASVNTAATTPGTAVFHPGVAKGYISVASNGTGTGGYNASSARSSTGTYTITWGTHFSATSYIPVVTGLGPNFLKWAVTSRSVGSCVVETNNDAGNNVDSAFTIVAFGDFA